ncbi:hypothetical protein F5I97DRAFT_1794595, partial [Phlebopus sp. FC_14]
GRDAKQVAFVDQWVHFAEYEIGIYLSYMSRMLHHSDQLLEQENRSLRFLESFLASRLSGLFLIHGEISLADIVVATTILACRGHDAWCHCWCLYSLVFAHHAKVSPDTRLKEIFGEPGFVDEAV